MTIDLDKIQPPAAHDFATFLTHLSKAELHVRVVGAIRPTTLADLAAHHGVVLPRSIDWPGYRRQGTLGDWGLIGAAVCLVVLGTACWYASAAGAGGSR